MSTQQAQCHTYIHTYVYTYTAVERVRGIESDCMYGAARQTPSLHNALYH
jgi:hypothetical protein